MLIEPLFEFIILKICILIPANIGVIYLGPKMQNQYVLQRYIRNYPQFLWCHKILGL